MKTRKFSKEWFENKLLQAYKSQDGRGYRLNPTKGWKPDIRSQHKKMQRINDLLKLAKEKNIKL